METAREMTLQQSIEVATRNWASIHNRGRCPRCSGLMVDEWHQDLSDYRAQRCVQCGEMIDPVILRNRGGTVWTNDNSTCREDVAEQLRDEGST